MVTNGDLISNPGKWEDKLFIATCPPKNMNNGYNIVVDLDQAAAVFSILSSLYPRQPTVRDILSGKYKDTWLLSGGTLIWNKNHEIAIGLRDGNGTDPFVFTNIGAGRCDRKLEDHCLEELASEFILCVKENGEKWQQVNFGVAARSIIQLSIRQLERPAVQRKIDTILKDFDNNSIALEPEIFTPRTETLIIKWGTLIIKWGNEEEELKGYVYLDEGNRTTEFRLPIQIDLSKYADSAIFYGEGTGYAVWKTIEQIKALKNAQLV